MEDLAPKEGQTTAVLGSTPSPTVAEVLNAAADRLEKPGAWTQGYWAHNSAGNKVSPFSPAATCWCVAGAIQLGRGDSLAAQSAVRAVIGEHLPTWNDAEGRTAEEVVSALRAAASKQVGGGE